MREDGAPTELELGRRLGAGNTSLAWSDLDGLMGEVLESGVDDPFCTAANSREARFAMEDAVGAVIDGAMGR